MKNGVLGRMTRAGAALFVAVIGLGGCANQQQLDMALDENRSLKNSINELQSVNSQIKNENELLQKQRISNEAALAEYKGMNDELRKKIGMSEEDYKKLLARLDGLAFGPLDRDTDAALAALAAKYPDLMIYDSERGMLRFASDLTFDSGQDHVKDNAATSLAALGKILTSHAASAYEVMIVGHTDAQPISSVTAKNHPTNMHLSCHRAIAVRSILGKQGVPANKMYAAGWGEERPLVPNGARGNTPQNRRVEIFLTRPTGTPVPVNSPGESNRATPMTEGTPTRQPDMTK